MNELRDWQTKQLPTLRKSTFLCSKFEDVTIVVYCYPPKGQESELFQWIECSILQTWKCIGLMKTVIVVNHPFQAASDFAAQWSVVEVQEEPSLVPGTTWPMSLDCIKRLHTRFSTPYCLIIQDDGFPLQNNLGDFLGKWDYIGAPVVTNKTRKITDRLGLTTLNGGFSLRSRKICKNASKSLRTFWRLFLRPGNRLLAEDVFYTFTAKLSPLYRFRHRFPSSEIAFSFSYDDLDSSVSKPAGPPPVGFHGKSTAKHFLVPAVRETPPDNDCAK